MEYTGNIMQDDTHLTSLLLKMLVVFEIRLSCGDNDLDIVYLKCINCKKEIGLNSETRFTWVYDEVITKFLLNATLHHVGIIDNKLQKEMDYYTHTNRNNLD